ncbi:MAG: hypothetical protein RLZZ347_398 [Candidatus Parcubacteria bacterium]|jgi:hypothetical protein
MLSKPGAESEKKHMEISVKVLGTSAESPIVTAVISGMSIGGFGATESKIKFLGSSCASSVLPGTATEAPTLCGLSSFTIQVEKEKPAVIALVTDVRQCAGKRVTHRVDASLIPVCWNNGMLEVKHQIPFVSKIDCLGQIISDDLTVVVGAKRFSTCHKTMFGDDSTRQKMQRLQAEGYAIVPDGNLLCRFLVGEATLDEVEKAVTVKPVDVAELENQLALSALEVETLRAEKVTVVGLLEAARTRSAELFGLRQGVQDTLTKLIPEYERLQADHLKLGQEKTDLERALADLKTAYTKLLDNHNRLESAYRAFRSRVTTRFNCLWDILQNQGVQYVLFGWGKVGRALAVIAKESSQLDTEDLARDLNG